ncbi:MAG: hypothetical protein GTO53_00650 [Planctomycetales bacterium]|nr:hypothetical protein [Planctomycetales bacterium]NIM07690.1 hypothetical protein [Planctomycetales bacterium]NIN07193.1 hypothetical protein [Planctomycetales bacterium]NIN76286.1 hypothetical protein [Planctomycetales bacterium]NIO33492.1 hypothetical protein [Planctomycetales bacterium]
MKTKQELQAIIDQIASADSPVGMDAVYVHALILDRLTDMSRRLEQLEREVQQIRDASRKS